MYSKSLRIFTLLIMSLFLLSGCNTEHDSKAAGNGNAAVNGAGTVTIAATFYPVYIMALNVTRDMPGVRVIDMTKPTAGCLHDYSITPDDMRNLEDARFLIINGAGIQSFMHKVLKQFPKLKIVDSSSGIQLIKSAGDTGYNPHLWVSISNAIQQVKNIGSGLAAMDPDNASKYEANTASYVKKLEGERDKMHKALDDVKNRDIITFHEAFPYFAKEFNLNIAGVIEREPGSEPSARELAGTIDTINSLKVRALFAEPQYPATAAETISRETGSKVYTLDPAVTGPMDPDAYIRIMDDNLKILQEALR